MPAGDRDEGPGGHYVTAGGALIGLGALGLIVAVLSTLVFRVDLRFLDGRDMAMTSFGLLTLGGWMVHHGRTNLEP
ncbi:MAG: hypothetical protein AAF928_05395 [Myxococcota bacterium]